MSNAPAPADFSGQIIRTEPAPLEPHTVVGVYPTAKYANKEAVPATSRYSGMRVIEYVTATSFNEYQWHNNAWLDLGQLIELSYSELETLVDNNLLIPGRLYVLSDYQCIYLIPYSTTDELSSWDEVTPGSTGIGALGKVVYKPEGVVNIEVHDGTEYGSMTAQENPGVPYEKIILRAVSANSFDRYAQSLTYPDETLIYDFNNNSFDDGLGSPVDRPGWILEREDRVRNIRAVTVFPDGTQGDYRYVRFRRWKANFDQDFANASLPALDTETVEQEQLYYISKPGFAVGVKPDDYTFTNTGAAITDGDSYVNPSTIEGVGIFKDYEALPLGDLVAAQNIDVLLSNTVLIPTKRNPSYYPGLSNFKITTAYDSTININFAYNVEIDHLQDCAHISFLKSGFYTHFGVKIKGFITNTLFFNYLFGLTVKGDCSIRSSMLVGNTIQGEIVQGLTASILNDTAGYFEGIFNCFINLGKQDYTKLNEEHMRFAYCSNSLFTGSGATYGSFEKVGNSRSYISGKDYQFQGITGVDIGSDGNEKDLQHVKVLLPITIALNSTALSNVVVDKRSPDGELWYDSVDNVGAVTPTKLA